MAYAEKTAVTVERSQAEVQQTLRRYGATAYVSGWQGDRAMIEFAAAGRRIRFVLQLPDDRTLFTKAGNRTRTAAQVTAAMEQEHRRRWRALALVIKAKLEAVESGIVTFEDEFLAHVVLPNGHTVAEDVGPAIEQAYQAGRVTAPLLALEGRSS